MNTITNILEVLVDFSYSFTEAQLWAVLFFSALGGVLLIATSYYRMSALLREADDDILLLMRRLDESMEMRARDMAVIESLVRDKIVTEIRLMQSRSGSIVAIGDVGGEPCER